MQGKNQEERKSTSNITMCMTVMIAVCEDDWMERKNWNCQNITVRGSLLEERIAERSRGT